MPMTREEHRARLRQKMFTPSTEDSSVSTDLANPFTFGATEFAKGAISGHTLEIPDALAHWAGSDIMKPDEENPWPYRAGYALGMLNPYSLGAKAAIKTAGLVGKHLPALHPIVREAVIGALPTGVATGISAYAQEENIPEAALRGAALGGIAGPLLWKITGGAGKTASQAADEVAPTGAKSTPKTKKELIESRLGKIAAKDRKIDTGDKKSLSYREASEDVYQKLHPEEQVPFRGGVVPPTPEDFAAGMPGVTYRPSVLNEAEQYAVGMPGLPLAPGRLVPPVPPIAGEVADVVAPAVRRALPEELDTILPPADIVPPGKLGQVQPEMTSQAVAKFPDTAPELSLGDQIAALRAENESLAEIAKTQGKKAKAKKKELPVPPPSVAPSLDLSSPTPLPVSQIIPETAGTPMPTATVQDVVEAAPTASIARGAVEQAAEQTPVSTVVPFPKITDTGKTIAKDDIHAIAERLGVESDAEKNSLFSQWTEKLTGKAHLDDMNKKDFYKVAKALELGPEVTEAVKRLEDATKKLKTAIRAADVKVAKRKTPRATHEINWEPEDFRLAMAYGQIDKTKSGLLSEHMDTVRNLYEDPSLFRQLSGQTQKQVEKMVQSFDNAQGMGEVDQLALLRPEVDNFVSQIRSSSSDANSAAKKIAREIKKLQGREFSFTPGQVEDVVDEGVSVFSAGGQFEGLSPVTREGGTQGSKTREAKIVLLGEHLGNMIGEGRRDRLLSTLKPLRESEESILAAKEDMRLETFLTKLKREYGRDISGMKAAVQREYGGSMSEQEIDKVVRGVPRSKIKSRAKGILGPALGVGSIGTAEYVLSRDNEAF